MMRVPTPKVAGPARANEIEVLARCGADRSGFDGPPSEQAAQNSPRLILLAGTARSGTTWLGNILNSSPQSLYAHEPLLRYADEELAPLFEQIRMSRSLSWTEREIVLNHWSRAFHAIQRPPFFYKQYSAWPPQAPWAAWLLVHALNRGYRLFQKTFTPRVEARYDLVVKQGGLAAIGHRLVQALAPDALVIIMRHPCAVVASMQRGRRLGVMAGCNRNRWIKDNLAMAEEAGYGRMDIAAMSDVELEAINWLIENTVYQKLLDGQRNSHCIIYRDLYLDPFAIATSLFNQLGWQVTEQTRRFLTDTSGSRKKRLRSLLTARHSYFSVYRKSRDNLDSWKRELSQAECDQIIAITRPLLVRYWDESSTT